MLNVDTHDKFSEYIWKLHYSTVYFQNLYLSWWIVIFSISAFSCLSWQINGIILVIFTFVTWCQVNTKCHVTLSNCEILGNGKKVLAIIVRSQWNNCCSTKYLNQSKSIASWYEAIGKISNTLLDTHLCLRKWEKYILFYLFKVNKSQPTLDL